MTVRKMPAQQPATSEQVVQTDPLFMRAVERTFGTIHVDLAATRENTQAPVFISKEVDSLSQNWTMLCTKPHTRMWLNPEFSDIGAWAKKCSETVLEDGGVILLLTPASVGANWFRDYVAEKARVLFLNGRLKFVGHKQPYPKDCILSVYGVPVGYRVWSWK